jgi:hypothetical protein
MGSPSRNSIVWTEKIAGLQIGELDVRRLHVQVLVVDKEPVKATADPAELW